MGLNELKKSIVAELFVGNNVYASETTGSTN
jgi:hypothetical protein